MSEKLFDQVTNKPPYILDKPLRKSDIGEVYVSSISSDNPNPPNLIIKTFNNKEDFNREKEIAEALTNKTYLPDFHSDDLVDVIDRNTSQSEVKLALIYEKIEGKSLSDILTDYKTEEEKLAALVKVLDQINQLAEYGLSKGYFLTDFSPENFVIEGNSINSLRVKMVDYGAFINQNSDAPIPKQIDLIDPKLRLTENASQIDKNTYKSSLQYNFAALAYTLLSKSQDVGSRSLLFQFSEGIMKDDKFVTYPEDADLAEPYINIPLPDKSMNPQIFKVLDKGFKREYKNSISFINSLKESLTDHLKVAAREIFGLISRDNNFRVTVQDVETVERFVEDFNRPPTAETLNINDALISSFSLTLDNQTFTFLPFLIDEDNLEVRILRSPQDTIASSSKLHSKIIEKIVENLDDYIVDKTLFDIQNPQEVRNEYFSNSVIGKKLPKIPVFKYFIQKYLDSPRTPKESSIITSWLRNNSDTIQNFQLINQDYSPPLTRKIPIDL